MTDPIGGAELRLLRVFVAVARYQGLAAAQHELGLSLPTISAHVARLEERLGLRLCERGRSGFRLTDEGRRVVELAQGLLGAVEDFSSEVGALKHQLRGSLRIAIIDNIVNNPKCGLPETLSDLERRCDEVEVHLDLIAPNQLESAISEERFHLGVGPAMKQLPSLTYEPLFDEEQRLYCAIGHPLFEVPDEQVHERDLAACRYVAHLFPIPEFRADGRPLPVAAKSQYMESVAMLIRSGGYIGFLPIHYAEDWVRLGHLRALRPTDYRYTNTFYAITRKHRQATRMMSVFREILFRHHAGATVGATS